MGRPERMERRPAATPRVVALLLVVVVASAAVLIGRSGGSASDPRRAASGGAAPSASSAGQAASVPRRTHDRGRISDRAVSKAVGQKLVARYVGRSPSPSLVRAARGGRVGGVILFSDNIPNPATAAAAVARLQRAARAGGNPPLLVLVDQEGGTVKRVPGAPPKLSAAEMGASAHLAQVARSEGAATGAALRRMGVNVDLAPVADVAHPESSWLGSRAFAAAPGTVARAACAFADGLRSAGVAATLKHFPGLGAAPASTDTTSTVVRVPAAVLRGDLMPYRRCARTVPLVMVSSATYTAIPGGRPAVLTPAVYRHELPAVGFRGVTISDDMETPALASMDHPARHALAAGLDLLLYAQHETTALTAYDRLLADVDAGLLERRSIVSSARRIAALKRRITQREGG